MCVRARASQRSWPPLSSQAARCDNGKPRRKGTGENGQEREGRGTRAPSSTTPASGSGSGRGMRCDAMRTRGPSGRVGVCVCVSEYPCPCPCPCPCPRQGAKKLRSRDDDARSAPFMARPQQGRRTGDPGEEGPRGDDQATASAGGYGPLCLAQPSPARPGPPSFRHGAGRRRRHAHTPACSLVPCRVNHMCCLLLVADAVLVVVTHSRSSQSMHVCAVLCFAVLYIRYRRLPGVLLAHVLVFVTSRICSVHTEGLASA